MTPVSIAELCRYIDPGPVDTDRWDVLLEEANTLITHARQGTPEDSRAAFALICDAYSLTLAPERRRMLERCAVARLECHPSTRPQIDHASHLVCHSTVRVVTIAGQWPMWDSPGLEAANELLDKIGAPK